MTEMETPIARVRGLGSAREGGAHWWQERQSAVAAFLLYLWLIVSLVRLAPLDQRTMVEWLRDPAAAVPMLLLVWVTFRHLRDGLQVVIEDYVHEEGNKFFTLLLLNFFAVGAGALAAFAVLKIALGNPGA
ncbi:MAG TPA: succinate dehydrogenase, hydrophobic membrane anchor protein [Allosphingosinicella sp.]|jgi:succinate dehydrogenase / fumarate reductase membrane anchor subunit